MMQKLISLNLVQLKAAANSKVFNLDLKELRVSADLQLSGTLFQICGAEKLNAASPCLVLTLGTQSRPVPDDLRGRDGS